MSEQIQGVIKCGRGEGGFDYKGHYRAGLFFDRHGREFIVDDRPVAKLKAEVEREFSEVEKQKPVSQEEDLERQEKLTRLKVRLTALKAGYIEEANKPLILSGKLFEYLREVNGKQLVFEPWDGQARPLPAPELKMTADERIGRLEEGLREVKQMLGTIVSELKRK